MSSRLTARSVRTSSPASLLHRALVACLAAALLTGCTADSDTGTGAQAPLPNSQPGDAGTLVAWNQVARDLVVRYATGPAPAMRVYALVSVAQYHALHAATPAGASTDAAVAAASAAVLTYLYPAEEGWLEARVDAQETVPTSSSSGNFATGEQLGRQAAAILVARARGDEFFAPFTGTVPNCEACWRATPTPPAFATLGQAKTFVLERGDQFRPPPPPAFGSAAFRVALSEVRQIAQTRTPSQDSIARVWALPAGTITPLGYWNAVATTLIGRYHLNERTAAHLLALMNMAGFDALVASHEAKYHYWLLRPTQADPSIVASIGVPSFPAYPSNHAAISAAAATVLSFVFPRERPVLLQAAEDAAISRVFGGIHYRFDADAGIALGRQVGEYVLRGVRVVPPSGGDSDSLSSPPRI